jgi:uncharacterized delta-60 repeat protein
MNRAGIITSVFCACLECSTHGQNADAFDPNATGGIGDGVLVVAVQPDSNIIIGGTFTNVAGMTRSNLARVDINGNLDASFDPEPNGEIRALAVQTNGQILVSGFFTTMGGIARNRIARLNSNGTLDMSFNPEVTGDVYGLLVQGDGKIIVWGEFSQLAGQNLNRIGRLNSDGTLDTSFNPGSGANDSILSVALQADGKMVVGGYHFSTLAGHACNGIGRLDTNGTFDTSFNSYFPAQNQNNLNIVYNLLVQPDGRILLGGTEREGGSSFYGYVLRLKADGSLDGSFQRESTDATIGAMALQVDGKVLVGGHFTTLGGPRSNIARVNADGSADNSFDPGADAYVHSLSVQADGEILVGGKFTALAGQPRSLVGRLMNTGTVQQSFAVNAKGTAINWQRSGPGPEIQEVTFEQSHDGTNYTFLGGCTYFSGGWQLAGISVPAVQTFYLRARGRAVGGIYCASSGLIEQVAQIYWVPPPLLFLDNGAFRYTFSGASNANFTVFATADLNLLSSNWTSLGPAAYLGDGYYQYTDLAATNYLSRFYRAVEQ